MSLVGRIVKETTDTKRRTVDFAPVLDPNETITVQNIKVILGNTGWSNQPFPAVPPADPTPLVIASTTVINTSTAVQIEVNSGTPGNVYTVQGIIQGSSSGRVWTFEIGVQITGTSLALPPPLPNPSTQDALPIGGGTMLGPLYLFENPETAMEAVNKQYVDNSLAVFAGDLAAEATARMTEDNTLQAEITAETARAEAAEAALNSATYTLVLGAGLSGTGGLSTGTMIMGGTVDVSGTIVSNWQSGVVTATGAGTYVDSNTIFGDWQPGLVTALGTGLAINSGTIEPNYTAGALSTIGAGLTLATGTLEASWQVPIGEITNLGTGLAVNTGTISAEWSAGAVSSVVGGSISGGTLTVSSQTQEWTAGSISALGAGLAISGTTLELTTTGTQGGSATTDGTGHVRITYGTPFATQTNAFIATVAGTGFFTLGIVAQADRFGADVYTSNSATAVSEGPVEFYWIATGE